MRAALRAAVITLRNAGVPSPEVDARALLERALGLSPAALLLRGAETVDPRQAGLLEGLLSRRAAREPLQYLLGELEWGGVRLRVDARALVPRPETEWLLHLALQGLAPGAAPRVLDVGTGTGALALGVKAARPDARVTATDLSPQALALARENAALNGLEVAFVHTDLLSGLDGHFDLILSNPPYLPDHDRDGAQPEVRHDPDMALYAGPDGLEVARALAAQARSALAPGGPLLLELDPRNAALFAAELRAAGWQATVHPDLSGRERFVQADLG
ncbi:peptide chain release factor N(5)-glutamine methyltransferase [Deinococcus koreensis]|uniref:Release factor glutamine methyltransferase n=1 Tax=Deinococcus koreensis TaxID=2054903 RepID=A0A2K3V2J4_9DEIO|nr:peptide chain release factor N(5)-glutamine methyltransferase [Deinococcus koreensis]PNY82975.1 peptide chain release factor N(5)-glutamine methyltransferase [Deinococcus koreensis]